MSWVSRAPCTLASGAAVEGEAWPAAHRDSAVCSLPVFWSHRYMGTLRRSGKCKGFAADMIQFAVRRRPLKTWHQGQLTADTLKIPSQYGTSDFLCVFHLQLKMASANMIIYSCILSNFTWAAPPCADFAVYIKVPTRWTSGSINMIWAGVVTLPNGSVCIDWRSMVGMHTLSMEHSKVKIDTQETTTLNKLGPKYFWGSNRANF